VIGFPTSPYRNIRSCKSIDLIHYYRDRKTWLVDPDSLPATVSPCSMSAQLTAASH
jgi:hypothetical protein